MLINCAICHTFSESFKNGYMGLTQKKNYFPKKKGKDFEYVKNRIIFNEND